MRKILLVGKVNDILRSLNDALSEEFQVQLSAPDTNMVLSITELSKPDLIIISLIGSGDIVTSLFDRINHEHRRIPVITIGNKVEVMRFAPYFVSGQFENLERPVDNDTVVLRHRLHTLRFTGT